MTLRSRLLFGLAVSIVPIVACSAADSTDADTSRDVTKSGAQSATVPSDGARSACSTGPAYAYETAFPSTDTLDPSLPECVPRCENGDTRSGYGFASQAWKLAALPSGACSSAGEACQMGAVRTRTCPSGETSMCSFTGYECRCEGGSWRCYSGPRGASACTC